MDYRYPQWTDELTRNFVTGEDQLGVEGAAQSYQQYLVPGIITTTDHARYYSFYAWILYRFINNESRLIKDFRGKYYKRHEVALIVGAYSHHPEEILSGLTGSGNNNSKAREMWESGDQVSLDNEDYFKHSLGGFGQYYRPAMQALEIIADNEHPNWVYRLTQRGKGLAEAYEESIRETAYFKYLKKEGTLDHLSRRHATEYGRVGCICPEALAHSKDRQLLREAFFRFDQADGEQNSHVRRRWSLGVTLDLVRSARGKLELEMIRPALYLGEFEKRKNYTPSKSLSHWAERWKAVEARHVYTFGLQCLFGAFLLFLSGNQNGISFEEFLTWIGEHLPKGVFEKGMSEYLTSLCHAVGLHGNWTNAYTEFAEACRASTEKDEYSLFNGVYEGRRDAQILLRTGLQILAQHFLRFLPRHEGRDPTWADLANKPRLPMHDCFEHLRQCLSDSNWTIKHWLEWLYRDYILGQHEFIGLEKLRFQRYDTFKFHYRDGRFYWALPHADDYHEPIRLAGLRLHMALSILTDLGLVKLDREGRYDLSADGETYLQRTLKENRDGN
ncbi:MAG: hypothetical protein M1282_06575 [Chloroflexi bacterium]|nr:hypothetical protein [Chloroflexota bacterium]